MEVAVNRSAEMLPYELRRFEIELEPADEIDVERVETGEQRLESEPMPARDASAQHFTAALVALVIEYDAVVGIWHLDRRRSGSYVIQMRDEITR